MRFLNPTRSLGERVWSRVWRDRLSLLTDSLAVLVYVRLGSGRHYCIYLGRSCLVGLQLFSLRSSDHLA